MTNAAEIAIEAIPALVDWIKVALAAGRDPKAELAAMLDTTEIAALIAEKEKFT